MHYYNILIGLLFFLACSNPAVCVRLLTRENSLFNLELRASDVNYTSNLRCCPCMSSNTDIQFESSPTDFK